MAQVARGTRVSDESIASARVDACTTLQIETILMERTE